MTTMNSTSTTTPAESSPESRRPTPGARPRSWTREQIEQGVRSLGKWFHNLDLHGVQTAPDHFLGDYPNFKWKTFAHAVPADLSGRTVLDIGCNAGFYSIEMKKRGAERVVGVDWDERYLAQARFAAEVSGFAGSVEFRKLSVYDVAALGEQFDLVIFMGVLYHLRHPLLALDLIHEHAVRTNGLMLFQSMQRGSTEIERPPEDAPFQSTEMFDRPGYPKLHFIERKYSGDITNWWVPNQACAEAMLRAAGFRIQAHPEQEVYLCRRIELTEDIGGPRPVYPARSKDEG
jgi:tRNA (mo5U34)-methyltransferase